MGSRRISRVSENFLPLEVLISSPPRAVTRLSLIGCQVTGLDGNYRITCHTVMEVLREHRDSVMAVLEAFVYDPLLNWRLMDSKSVGLQDPRRRRISDENISFSNVFFFFFTPSKT